MRALLQEEIEWTYLLSAARSHGVMPLLYWHLNATYPDAVPKTTMDQLREDFRANSRRNLFLTGELLRLLDLFEAQEVPVVPYKGPALAASVYGNLAFRQFSDLDILVHRQDFSRAKELLVSSGYRPELQLNRAHEALYLQYEREYTFTRDDGAIKVEIHWEMMSRYFSFALDTECLMRRLQPITLGGKTVPSLLNEDLLLILCVHGSKHLWERLAWIRDVAGLIQAHQSMDWEWVTRQAEALGGSRMLSLGLLLARDLLGAGLPDKISQRVQADPVVESLAADVRERLFSDVDNPPGLFEESIFHPFCFKMRERLRDKIRYFMRAALTPGVKEWAILPLPPPLFPLYYALRPVRLAGQYGRRIVERFVR